MSYEHDYYSDQCAGCKWAEWRGGCLNKATADDGSDLDAADRDECKHFEAGQPQRRPPQPEDRVYVHIPLAEYDALQALAEDAKQRAEAWRWFAQEVASDIHPIGADPLGDITTDFLPVLLDITRRAAQQQGADCARAEAAEQRAEAAEAALAQARADQAEARGFLAECRKQLDELEGILSDTLAARARAEAEAERLRSAIAETLRLADIYAGVAAHNAEAEPETAGEAWRSPYMTTMRELRRALGGAA